MKQSTNSLPWLPTVAVIVAFLAWMMLVVTNTPVPEQIFADPLYVAALVMILVAGVVLFAPTVYRYRTKALWIWAAGVGTNLGLGLLTHFMEVPFYFAIGGSAFVGFAAGPLAGLAVGAFTSVLGSLLVPELLPMVLLFMLPGALLWVAMMEGWVSTVARMMVTGCMLALASGSILLINRLTVLDGIYHNGAENLTTFITMVEPNAVKALIYQTAITQILDKLLFLFLGNAVLQILLPRTRLKELCVAEPARSIVQLMSDPKTFEAPATAGTVTPAERPPAS